MLTPNTPPELVALFEKANEALFNLHRELEKHLKDMDGRNLWRPVYAMRIDMNQIRQMAENNFKEAKSNVVDPVTP